MTDTDFETLYKSTSELTPSSELKDGILLRMSEEMEKKNCKETKRPFAFVAKRLLPIAACFVLLISVGVFFFLRNENYQTVYIDVNPSVALHVNRFGNVNGVDYLNEDAREVLGGIKLKRLAVGDALETIIGVYDEAGYFDDGAELYISAVSEKNKNCDKLLAKLEERAEKAKGSRGYSVNVKTASKEDKNEAKEYGLSPAKYRLIQQIIEKEPTHTVEDLKDKSMSELKEMLNK